MSKSLSYPIGKFECPEHITDELLQQAINDIHELPQRLQAAVKNRNNNQLDTPYRPGGWTIRQLVHHIADSHMNAFTRFKLALTEDNPTIKPYQEAQWAEMSDYKDVPVQVSLHLILPLHFRWTALLQSMTVADFARTYYHPEDEQTVRLDHATLMYSWHSRHHLQHVLNAP